MFKNKYEFIEALTETARSVCGREYEECSPQDKYYALARAIAAEAGDIHASCLKSHTGEDK